MVRNYIRKTERKLFSPKKLMKAKKLIANGYCVNAAARKLNVNECTLRRHLISGEVSSSLGRFSKTFSNAEEKEIVKFLLDLNERFYGIPKRKLGPLVYQFAEKNGISHPFNKSKKSAGRDWCEAFIKRHGLSLRTCDELYVDPPTEDWIECGTCHRYEWHEDCTSHEGYNVFQCDLCSNSP